MKLRPYEVTAGRAVDAERPERGNGLTRGLIEELTVCRAGRSRPGRARLLLSGNGKGFCGGYDLVDRPRAGRLGSDDDAPRRRPGRHSTMGDAEPRPRRRWDPMLDHTMMSRNVRAFMSLFHCSKAGRVQGPRLLCRRRDRYGAVLGPAPHRGRREDRLSAGARVGLADDLDVGLPSRCAEGEATAIHGRLAERGQALEWGLAIEAPPRRSSTRGPRISWGGSPSYPSISCR